ncbi:hypothetical protein LXL04_015415 [Taraxacum kok-saghyz]
MDIADRSLILVRVRVVTKIEGSTSGDTAATTSAQLRHSDRGGFLTTHCGSRVICLRWDARLFITLVASVVSSMGVCVPESSRAVRVYATLADRTRPGESRQCGLSPIQELTTIAAKRLMGIWELSCEVEDDVRCCTNRPRPQGEAQMLSALVLDKSSDVVHIETRCKLANVALTGPRRDKALIASDFIDTSALLTESISKPNRFNKKKLALNATIMVTIERKSVPRPNMSFLGNDSKKSRSA